MGKGNDLKSTIKGALKDQEIRLTEGLLRWKYQKEGKPLPAGAALKAQAGEVAANAHDVVAKRGKRIFQEFRKALKGDDS